MKKGLDWKGDEVRERVVKACLVGINRVLARCAILAKTLVRVRTAVLQGSIRTEPAVNLGGRARGVWGSFDVNYALWQEIGTAVMRAQPYLRPAADAEYRGLAGEIRKAL